MYYIIQVILLKNIAIPFMSDFASRFVILDVVVCRHADLPCKVAVLFSVDATVLLVATFNILYL